MQISLDQQRLHLVNVQEEDESLYMCVAKNSAGEATREFQLIVICKFFIYLKIFGTFFHFK